MNAADEKEEKRPARLGGLAPGPAIPIGVVPAGWPNLAKPAETYWEIGGAGGPAGAGGGAEAVTAGDGSEDNGAAGTTGVSGEPLEAATGGAETAGVTSGTGSARGVDVSLPLSFGISVRAASDLAPSGGLFASGLATASLAVSGVPFSSVTGSGF